MQTDYQHLIPEDFDENSRVWVYQSSRLFSIPEALQIEVLLNNFIEDWKSHGAPVKGYANLLFGQFVVIMADEKATGVSGCSTDGSVRLIKQIEQIFRVNMFDRQILAFIVKDKVQLLPLAQLKYAFENGYINEESLYFNNLVATKKELLNNWLIPIKQSWLVNKLPLAKAKD